MKVGLKVDGGKVVVVYDDFAADEFLEVEGLAILENGCLYVVFKNGRHRTYNSQSWIYVEGFSPQTGESNGSQVDQTE